MEMIGIGWTLTKFVTVPILIIAIAVWLVVDYKRWVKKWVQK